jgi:hypothetical protein
VHVLHGQKRVHDHAAFMCVVAKHNRRAPPGGLPGLFFVFYAEADRHVQFQRLLSAARPHQWVTREDEP